MKPKHKPQFGRIAIRKQTVTNQTNAGQVENLTIHNPAPAAEPADENLTIPITMKTTESGARRVKDAALSAGMATSEFIRDAVERTIRLTPAAIHSGMGLDEFLDHTVGLYTTLKSHQKELQKRAVAELIDRGIIR